MNAFILNIPTEKRTWAKTQAAMVGGTLMGDELSDSIVLLAPTLPDSLKRYTPEALAKATSQHHPSATPKIPPLNVKIHTYALDIPFEYRGVASSAGAKWDKDGKCWLYKGPSLPASLEPFEAQPWSWEASVLQGRLGEIPKGWQGTDPLTPRPHQYAAAQCILNAQKADYPGFLLADDVGLGKTLSAWMGVQEVAKSIKAQRILIVCPLSVQAHWRETLKRQGSSIGQVLIMNYERLSKLFEMPEGVKAKSKKGVARRAQAAEVDIIVFDESHKLKNPTSARSKLAAKLISASQFTLWLSATAGQSPLELSYLASLIAKATGVKVRDLNDFEGWCQAQGFQLSRGAYGAWVWDGNVEDCKKLASILFDGKIPPALRRRPQEIAGWPEISRALWPQELDTAQRQLYQTEWDLFKTEIRQQRDSTRKDSTTNTNKVTGKGLSGLVAALRFRQKSSLLRVQQTAQFAIETLENGIKPAISCAFVETLNQIEAILVSKKIACSRIDGTQSAAERERQRLRFQKGETQVVLFTIEEGISLHQGEYENVPRSLLIHDLRWSAIQMTQIEGRTHRNGQFAQAYWMLGEETIEHTIAERVAHRAVSMKALSGEVDINLEKEIIEELLKRV